MRIAFLGLGAMGARMAMTLVRAGHDTVVWNRSPGKADALVSAGAREAETPRAAAEGAAIVVSMVMDDDASRAVWTDAETGALHGMGSDAVAVECSTVSPGWARSLAGTAEGMGVAFLAAPVAGTLPPAESGELVILAGGDKAALITAQPALDAMGKATHHAGDAGDALAAKLVVNGMLAAQEAALAELLGLARRLGADPVRAFDLLCETPVASPMLKAYGRRMIEGADDVNFPVSGILKDLGLIDGAAREAGAEVPVTRAVRAGFEKAAEAGLSDADQTAIMRLHE